MAHGALGRSLGCPPRGRKGDADVMPRIILKLINMRLWAVKELREDGGTQARINFSAAGPSRKEEMVQRLAQSGMRRRRNEPRTVLIVNMLEERERMTITFNIFASEFVALVTRMYKKS